jgi:hypothetical protein
VRSVAHNNLYILHTCLFRYIDVADFFTLFAEAQRAYGTRVFSDVTFRGVSNCVCVVMMYRVCVFSVVETVVTVLHDVNARDARDLHTMLPLSHCASIDAHLSNLQSLPSPTEAESARSVLPDFRLQHRFRLRIRTRSRSLRR